MVKQKERTRHAIRKKLRQQLHHPGHALDLKATALNQSEWGNFFMYIIRNQTS